MWRVSVESGSRRSRISRSGSSGPLRSPSAGAWKTRSAAASTLAAEAVRPGGSRRDRAGKHDPQLGTTARDGADEAREVIEPATLVGAGRVARADEHCGHVGAECELGHLARVVALRRCRADAPRRARRHALEQRGRPPRRAEHGQRRGRLAAGLEPRQVGDAGERHTDVVAPAPGRRRPAGRPGSRRGPRAGCRWAPRWTRGGASWVPGLPSSATEVVAAPASMASRARGTVVTNPCYRLSRRSAVRQARVAPSRA